MEIFSQILSNFVTYLSFEITDQRIDHTGRNGDHTRLKDFAEKSVQISCHDRLYQTPFNIRHQNR